LIFSELQRYCFFVNTLYADIGACFGRGLSQSLCVAYISRRFSQIAPQISQIFAWVDGIKHLNTLHQKNLRNLRVNLRHLREINRSL